MTATFRTDDLDFLPREAIALCLRFKQLQGIYASTPVASLAFSAQDVLEPSRRYSAGSRYILLEFIKQFESSLNSFTRVLRTKDFDSIIDDDEDFDIDDAELTEVYLHNPALVQKIKSQLSSLENWDSSFNKYIRNSLSKLPHPAFNTYLREFLCKSTTKGDYRKNPQNLTAKLLAFAEDDFVNLLYLVLATFKLQVNESLFSAYQLELLEEAKACYNSVFKPQQESSFLDEDEDDEDDEDETEIIDDEPQPKTSREVVLDNLVKDVADLRQQVLALTTAKFQPTPKKHVVFVNPKNIKLPIDACLHASMYNICKNVSETKKVINEKLAQGISVLLYTVDRSRETRSIIYDSEITDLLDLEDDEKLSLSCGSTANLQLFFAKWLHEV